MNLRASTPHPSLQTTEIDLESLVQETEKLCERRSPEAERLVTCAEELAGQTNQPHHKLLAGYIRAYFECFVNNRYDTAIGLLNALLNVRSLYGLEPKIYLVLGNSHHLQGDLLTARKAYLTGIYVLDQQEKQGPEDQKLIGTFCYNLATILIENDLLNEAEQYLDRAIAQYTLLNKKFQLSKCYIAGAKIAEERKLYNKAGAHLKRAMALSTELNDAYNLALCRANLGLMQLKTAHERSYNEHLLAALEYYYSKNLQYESALVELELAQYWYEEATYKKALYYTSKAEEKLVQLKAMKQLAQTYRIQGQALAALQEYKAANHYLEKYLALTESVSKKVKEETNFLTRYAIETEQKLRTARRSKNGPGEITTGNANPAEDLKWFVRMASGNLREPVLLMQGYIHLLRKNLALKANLQEQEYFDLLQNGARETQEVLDHLLTIVTQVPVIEEVNTANILLSVQQTLAKQGEPVEISSTVLPVLSTDKKLLEYLLLHLISALLRYARPKPLALQVMTTFDSENTEIQLCSTGPSEGITNELTEAFKLADLKQHYHWSLAIKIASRLNCLIAARQNQTGTILLSVQFTKTTMHAL